MAIENPVSYHGRVIGALMMREIMTRYGRRGLGFVWLVVEPLMFCSAVLVMWSILKPAYEHGLRLGPFLMSGYMCLLLLRHIISYSMGAIQGNVGLLHHRQVHVLHLYLARNLLEFAGATAAFAIVYVALFALGQVSLPENILLMYQGWLILAFMATGLAMSLAALATQYEVMERVVPVLQYMLIPISGAFTMASWIPAHYRDIYLMIPLPHCVEMVRAGIFGEFVETHYSVSYALLWALLFNLAGLVLTARVRNHLDVE